MSSPIKITLTTGYAVDTEDADWKNHLTMALIGEMFLEGPPKEADWSTRMRLLVAELDRLHQVYGLNFYAWIMHVVPELKRLVAEAESDG